MSLFRALFSGVSGLRNHQIMMDVIGNNVSNVNTIGFKGGRASFSEMFAQTMNIPFRPVGDNGGINPLQVGLGSALNSVDTSFAQGNLESTGKSTDLGIQGSGFFIVKQNGKEYYSRMGTFGFDANGNMVLPGNGAILQGKLADSNGNISIGTKVENLKLQLDKKSPAKATSTVKLSGNLNSSAQAEVSYSGNLDSRSAVGDAVRSNVAVKDNTGALHNLSGVFTKTGPDAWSLQVTDPTAGWTVTGGTIAITFDPASGHLLTMTPSAVKLTRSGYPDVLIDMNGTSLTQTAASSSAAAKLERDAEFPTLSVPLYDSLGNQHNVTFTFNKTASNTWNWEASIPGPAVISGGGSGTVTFNSDGTLQSFLFGTGSALTIDPNNGASSLNVNLNPGSAGVFAGLTQTNNTSNITVIDQDGYGAGTLTNFSIGKDGKIQGQFSNGTIITLGQVVLAQFNNPSGLVKVGEGMYDVSGNSGTPAITSAGESAQAQIVGGTLEQSNVDLAEEFTRMIIAQRGFQSNARIITSTDEILNEVVNLKR